jgi:hypothetical protein
MIAEEVPGNQVLCRGLFEIRSIGLRIISQISPPLRPHVLTNLLQMTKEEYPTFKAVWGSVLATDAAYDAEYYQRILQDVKVEDASVTDGATCLLATCHRVVATRGFSSQVLGNVGHVPNPVDISVYCLVFRIPVWMLRIPSPLL